MNDSDLDPSPFAEKKSNSMVWIVPSVLLHIIILVVWLAMPKAPPREPSQRKLTINSQQAQQLQQHVEDANLVLLHSQVEELQAIKLAMAKIRDSKMEELREFETEMAMAAPTDAKEIFTRFTDAQNKILTAHKQLLADIKQSNTLMESLQSVWTEENLIEAEPRLDEVYSLWKNAKQQLNIINSETMLSYALVNTGDVQLEWILDPTLEQERQYLNQTMEAAQSANKKVASHINYIYGGKVASSLSKLSENATAYDVALKTFAQAQIDGEAAAEQKRQDIQAKIDNYASEITELKTKITSLTDERTVVQKQPDSKKAVEKLNRQISSAKKSIASKESAIKREKNALSKTKYSPDRKLRDKAKGIRSYLTYMQASKTPDSELITHAIQAQAEVSRASTLLIKTITQYASTSSAGGAE